MKMAHAPPGHHSVIGRPNSGGLCYPEYVVYRGEQVNYTFSWPKKKEVIFVYFLSYFFSHTRNT